MKARLALLATMFVVTVLNACSDPNALKANLVTAVDSLSLWALSGTPPAYPSGLSILARQAVRVDASASFDIAFDIDDDGNAVIYPVKFVVTTPGSSRAVGLQRVIALFDSVGEAPKTGYETDSALVLTPGQVVAIQSAHNFSQDLCQFAISPYLYAKVTVDSVNLASRLIYLRMGSDPNCGFRSFVAGIPPS